MAKVLLTEEQKQDWQLVREIELRAQSRHMYSPQEFAAWQNVDVATLLDIVKRRLPEWQKS